MPAVLSFNYLQQTVAGGTFNISSVGYVQGLALDDPAIRYQLAGGVLAQSETLPMWGGVGINETTTPNTGTNPPDGTQGGLITRATNISSTGAVGALTGFSVFNQAYGMANNPQSPVPLSGSGMQVMLYRLGSNIRIPVACAPALVTSGPGVSITQEVSWDFVGQQLIPYIAAYASASVLSATYTSSTGILALTFSAAPFGAGIGAGANGVFVSISGLTTSVGSAALVNGNFPIVSTSSAGTVINLQLATGLGTITINGSTGTLAAGGGALPVKVLEILGTNNMTVNYNPATNAASWNYNAAVAIIQI